LLEKETRITNRLTGEILKSTVHPIAPMFDEEKGYLFWPRKSFMKSFLDIEFPKEMSFKELGQMTALAKKMCPKTNMLGYRGNGGTRPYNVDKIGAVIGLKPSQSYTFVRKMIQLGVMAQVKIKTKNSVEVQYYVNPMYYFSGNRLNLNLYLLFHKQLDEHIPPYAKEEYRRQGGYR
jgi:hypothetical protein